MDRHSMWRSQAYDGAVFGINQFAYQRWCYRMHEYITVNLCNADKPFPLYCMQLSQYTVQRIKGEECGIPIA